MTASAQVAQPNAGTAPAERAKTDFLEIPINEIEKGGGTNLRELTVESVRELADSIKQLGVLEPVIVRRNEKGYQLVAGFRRVASAKVAGLRTIPAHVLLVDERAVAEVQMVENLQREDLSELEEARAMQAYLKATGSTQQQLATRIGKSQPYIANRIRLLGLPDKGAKLLKSGKITASAAEQLLRLPEDAAREARRAFAELERKAEHRGAVTVQEAKWAAESALRSYQERRRKERKIEAAKVPMCPSKGCGKPGRPAPEWSRSEDFTCAARHSWNPTTGKVTAREERRYGGYTPPPKPTLPVVDQRVPIAVPPSQLIRRVLEAAKEVHRVEISWTRGTRARVVLDAELPALKAASVPNITLGDGWKFVELESADQYRQRDDAGRRTAAKERADLESWLAVMGRAKKS